MTALELLAACALAAVLMVTVSSILGSLATQQKMFLRDQGDSIWRQRLLEQLDWDLANARSISCTPLELHLVGYGGRDFAKGAATQRPVIIVYRISPNRHENWLMRTETHVDEPRGLDMERTELVCRGVTKIELRTAGAQSENVADARWSHVPNRLRLVLRGESEQLPILDRVFLVNPFPSP